VRGRGAIPPEIGLKYKEKPMIELPDYVAELWDYPIKVNRSLRRAALLVAGRAKKLAMKSIHKAAQPGLTTTAWSGGTANMAYTIVPTSPGRSVAIPF
jgi:hypothetical protein